MNDFTKEELEHILGHLKWACDIEVTAKNIVLRDKIQSMIDNYCTHQWRASAIDAIYCPHCQKHIECEL